MKTQDEIVQRYRERKKADMFGFETGEYLAALDREHLERLREFLKPDADLSDWKPAYTSDEALRALAIEYMDFAWEKAKDCRGISAWRSLAHYQAWLWMLGDETLWPTLEDYEHYGKNELRKICEYFGLDANKWDDSIRVNNEEELDVLARHGV